MLAERLNQENLDFELESYIKKQAKFVKVKPIEHIQYNDQKVLDLELSNFI